MNMDRLPTPEDFNTPPPAPFHELAAILRLRRNGWADHQIMSYFRMTPGQFTREMNQALIDEKTALAMGETLACGKWKAGLK
jgi:hypothetical protein